MEKLPSGHRVFPNRCAWSVSHLSQAMLVERPQRGYVRLTELGRTALREHDGQFSRKHLKRYTAYESFLNRTNSVEASSEVVQHDIESKAEDASSHVVSSASELPPQELIEKALKENKGALQKELLDYALKLSPSGFENLVVSLLEQMGYGQAGNVERTSASGDAGVDGIISQDPLGLDRIYVQAKRYALDRTVDRPRIHEFAGALLGKQGDRGVFITTASFTRGAIAEAEKINARIELINGHRLSELMLKYKVGVQVEQRVEMFRIDGDYFESIDN